MPNPIPRPDSLDPLPLPAAVEAGALRRPCPASSLAPGTTQASASLQPDQSRWPGLFVRAAGWTLVAALVWAPWAYGGTRDWALHTLQALLGFMGLMWLAGCCVGRRWPRVSRWLGGLTVGLLLLGWGMALNAHHRLDLKLWQLQPVQPLWPGLPGAADGPTSQRAMRSYTGLLLATLVTAHLARRGRWRQRLWLTMVLTGVSVALFGVIQKLGGEPVLALTWEPDKRDLTNNFALFRCRNNAAAWLNLTLPLLVALAFVKTRKPGRPWSRSFWVCALLGTLTGIQLNPSRAGWAIAGLLLMAMLARVGWHFWRRRDYGLNPRRLWATAVAGALALGLMVGVIGWGGWLTGWQRWQQQGVDWEGRLPWEILLRMVRDAGPTGFGPGSFDVIFPAYQATHDFGGRLVPAFWLNGRWIHAHQDYLQTLIEWGCAGGLLWAGLLAGGLATAIRTMAQGRLDFPTRWLLFSCVTALMGVLIHATMDFPLQIASSQLYAAVLLGLCWGTAARPHPPPPSGAQE